ncbi:group II intron reverse transcriptase/maturase [Natronincola ferrireducens]|uniref:RNA-directed DNA polymerase n=1 Tax=Natronincola ferrireducens TaxID=393762 RepID=A0A1G8ZRZ4_9FIRM|nr:group II intron reverse transcriptase/maturase [Natronincola ferrireducens]SDK17374.1 RNA-directed DNA polymerase [Natronincola ferrireducens]
MKTIKKFNTSAVSPHIESFEMINWKKINKYVKKLRQRIFRAEQLGQKRKVRKLQRLMIKSKANLLLSIKKVTQINKGKKTAGVDGINALTSKDRLALYNLLKEYNVKYIRPRPAKRIYIPKKNGKMRPLGIPIIKDRIFQNVVKNALEPQWEARFESSSYGFRPKRSTRDAICNLFSKLSARSRKQWVFEGDFKGCFDNLNHQYIMDCLEGFPAKDTIYKWLKAGYVDNNSFNDTTTGTPQGSIVSPLLANIALHGMEKELGVKYYRDREYYKVSRNSVGIVRFADDFVIVCKTKEEAATMYGKLEPYLEKRGLTLAEDKTKITHISEGFDFLGFNLRKYKTNSGMKLLIKPSKASVKKARETIKGLFKQLRGRPVSDLITKLNPITRGIGNYWSSQVAKKIYSNMDRYIWIKVRKHLKTLHSNKSFKWIYKKYFKPDYTGVSKSQWILTDPHNHKTQLFKMSYIPIRRHVMVRYKNSPDDAGLKEYFEERDRKEFIRDNVLSRRKLAKRSNYKCRICRESLVGEESLKINQIVTFKLGGDERYDNLELLHKSCHEQHQKLLENYGGGKNLPKVMEFFKCKQVEPNSQEGYKLMKEAFKKFKYQLV